jgi:hypothetical protein
MPTSDKPRRRWNHWVVSLLGMFAAIGALTLLPQVERALAPVRSFGSYSTNKRPLSITLKTGEQASYRVAATYQASMTSPEPSMWHGLTFEISPLQAAPLRSQLSPSDVTALFDAFIAEVSANPSAFFADAHEIAIGVAHRGLASVRHGPLGAHHGDSGLCAVDDLPRRAEAAARSVRMPRVQV